MLNPLVEVYVGRIRSLVLVVLLSLITAGIYFFIWYYQLNRELRKHLGRGPEPALLLALFILVPFIGWFIATWATGVTLRKVQRNADTDRMTNPAYAAIWSLVPVVGWFFAAGFLQGGANRAWATLHATLDQASILPTHLECPQCHHGFEFFLNPIGTNPVACPACGRTGDL